MAVAEFDHHRLPLPFSGGGASTGGGRRRSRGTWGQESQQEGRMAPPPAPAPVASHGQTPSPASPFVMTEANVGLFNAVLSNWTLQDCRHCQMVLAAPGLYPIQQENNVVQGGRHLTIEAVVDGVTIRPLTHLAVYNGKLMLRRLTVDGNNQVFSLAGCLLIKGGTVEASNTTFQHHSGLNNAGVAWVSGPGASFLASGCTFQQNNCLEIKGAGAVTLNGSMMDEPVPWVALDRCSFYENSCHGGGGAIKAYGRGVLSITNSVFIGQQAQGFGGAVYASCEYNASPNHNRNPPLPFSAGDLTVTIQDCHFKRNQAARREYIWGGGAIYSHANLTLSNSFFYDNAVPSQIGQEEDDIAIGGGALWNDGILRGSDLYFEKNNAARMGGAVLLGRGSAVLRRCTFFNNEAGNQGGAIFVNASSPSSAAPTIPTADTTSLSGAFVQDCTFQGNSVTGFPAPYYTFSYPFGGGALAVWGRMLVHNSSFLDNVPPPCGELNGTVAHVDAHGVLQLAFCSFAASAGHQRHGLRPGDLHLATPHASARCLGTHVVSAAAAGAPGPQCFIGSAGGEPWAAPALVLLLGLPLCLALYIMALVARPWRQAARLQRAVQEWWEHEPLLTGDTQVEEREDREEEGADIDSDGSDGREEETAAVQEEARVGARGYDPAATFPIPPSGTKAMWRFLRGRRRRRKPSSASSSPTTTTSSSSSSSSQHLQQPQLDEEGRSLQLQQVGSALSDSTLSSGDQEPSSPPKQPQEEEEESGANTDKEKDGGSGSTGSGSSERGDDDGSRSGEEEEEEEEEEVAVLEWHKTRAYRLSLGAELRDPTSPGELSANHLEPFMLEGRGRNMFQVTDPQPLTQSRFGRLYFARNTGGGGGGGGGGSGAPCLMLVYNRFKHEATTLVTEKELLHTGSSSTCPFLLRHLDDFFHERVGYYVALTPCCRETLYQRLARAIQSPRDPTHALDFATCVGYLHEILQGLGALRDLRMVHGRLSLHAVLLTEDDHVRLWNYGVPSSAAVRRPDKPTVYSAPEAWDMLRMNPAPVSSMDSWSAGVVGYMLAAKALAVTLPPCAARYRGETYTDYFREYLLQRKTRRRRSYYDEGPDTGISNEGRVVALAQPLAAAVAAAPEPYFPCLPSVDPAFRDEDERDHGGAFVGVLSRLLDVNANRRMSLEMAELEVRQIVQRAVLLARARNKSNRGGGGGGGGDDNGEMSKKGRCNVTDRGR